MVTTSLAEKRPVARRPHGASQRAEAGFAQFKTRLGWTVLAWGSVGDHCSSLSGANSQLIRLTFGHLDESAACERLRADWDAGTLPQMELKSYAVSDLPTDSWQADLVHALRAYAEGERIEFGDVPLTLEHRTEFEQRIIERCRRIAYGATMSYGELASEAGYPRAARAVGNVMRKNAFPLVVPCHRVLASGGKLGGYSAPSGLTMKRRLLELEANQT